MTTAVFVSYRRDDSKHAAGRLAERLREHFTLFMDVDSVPPGSDFVSALGEAVDRADVVVAVIGPSWLSARDESGARRIDHPDDWVAAEISAALNRGIPVIPVLVDGARMPGRTELPPSLYGFADRQAISMTHESFSSDCTRLEEVLHTLTRRTQPSPREAELGEGADGPRAPGPADSVPRPTNALLGREQDLRALEELLGRPEVSIVTVAGPGGVGKTRLAVELAGREAIRREVLYIPLESIASAELVIPTIAAQMKVKPAVGLDVVEQIGAAMRGRALLLVLDNFEHVMEAASDLARLMHAASGLELLVTSREALRLGGEHVYFLEPLESSSQLEPGTPPRSRIASSRAVLRACPAGWCAAAARRPPA